MLPSEDIMSLPPAAGAVWAKAEEMNKGVSNRGKKRSAALSKNKARDASAAAPGGHAARRLAAHSSKHCIRP
jgi:hypothetical protein